MELALPPRLTVILAEEIDPNYVDCDIQVYLNSAGLTYAYESPYNQIYVLSTGDFISAVCGANIDPTGGANPVKILQILGSPGYQAGDNPATKLLWIHQDIPRELTFPIQVITCRMVGNIYF